MFWVFQFFKLPVYKDSRSSGLMGNKPFSKFIKLQFIPGTDG